MMRWVATVATITPASPREDSSACGIGCAIGSPGPIIHVIVDHILADDSWLDPRSAAEPHQRGQSVARARIADLTEKAIPLRGYGNPVLGNSLFFCKPEQSQKLGRNWDD